MAAVAKALGDPIRLQLVDVLRKHAGKVCVCELVPLFDLSQPTVSHHLKVLREAGIVGSERRGLWAYYYVNPEAAGGAERMAELDLPGGATRRRSSRAVRLRERYARGRAGGVPRRQGAGATRPLLRPRGVLVRLRHGASRTPARLTRSAPSSTPARSATRCPTRPSSPRSAAATQRPSPS